MQNKDFTDRIIEATWLTMNVYRAYAGTQELVHAALYAFYCYHKQYPMSESCHIYENGDDPICRDLHSQMLNVESCCPEMVNNIYNLLQDVDYSAFEDNYKYILIAIFEKLASYGGKYAGEFVTPKEINELIAYIVKSNNCKSVYDPFCGTAAIRPFLSVDGYKCNYKGQEYNESTAILARLMVEANGGSYDDIICGDSFSNWDQNHYDAVVTCPPFGIKINKTKGNTPFTCLEEYLLNQALDANTSDLFLVLTPLATCSSSIYGAIIERLVDFRNLLDTVIALPSNLLFGTSIPCALLVFKKDRDEEAPVRMLRLDEYYKEIERKKRIFDIERFYKLDINSDSADCSLVSCDDICESNFNLNPHIYKPLNVSLKEGQQIIKLEELLVNPYSRNTKSGECDNKILMDHLSNNLIEVLLNKNRYSDVTTTGRSRLFRTCNGDGKYILVSREGFHINLRYAIHTVNEKFCYPSEMSLYQVNEQLVTPEYLVYKLLDNDALKQRAMSLSSCLGLKLIIDNIETQKDIIERIKQQYDENQRAEREADAQRLGIKRSIGDLEHMLGTPQFKINQIISRLERMKPDAENYAGTVKSLRDNMEYMNRVIRFTNAQIDPTSFNMKDGSISEFISEYANGWKNYGGNYFDLLIDDNLGDKGIVSYDKTMLTLMFDSILSNAVRHGFLKDKKHTENNRVEISLTAVECNDKPTVLIKVANNGEPMKDNFSIEDYISRGRFTSTTGRSGLGGYHVFQVVKGHNGHLYLDSNKMWNMVVEIILPLKSDCSIELNEYEHEQECL